MYALDPATGAIQWSTSVGAAISAPAAVADGTVFVPTVSGGPAVRGGQLYVGTADGQVIPYGLP